MAKMNYLDTEIRVSVNSDQGKKAFQELISAAETLRTKLKEMKDKGLKDEDIKEFNELASDLNKIDALIQKSTKDMIKIDDVLKDISGQSIKTLRAALKQLKDAMVSLDPKKLADQGKSYTEEMAKMQVQARTLEERIESLTGTTRKNGKAFEEQGGLIAKTVKRLSSYVLVYSGYNFVKNQIANVAKENIDLSDSLADIRKVTGMTSDEVNELSKSLASLDTRTTTEGLNALAYEAGKIGLKGVDDVMQFVKAGNQIKVALGEDLGENALVELMKMSEVMGTTKTMGVEKSLLSIGSAINELSASSTASGEDINSFAKRLSGIAAQSQITTDQLLGLGSASSAMNMEVEVAATAFNKLINQIVAKTDVVAKAAGIEFEVLDEMIKSGETMEATVLVLEKLGQKGGLRGLAPIMGDLGSDGARLNQVIATFSKNVDVLKTHLKTSSTAFEQAISVTNEYNIKNETAAAIIQRMGNAIKEKFVNSGITEWITNILRSLYELPKLVEENKGKLIVAIVAITIALTGLETRIKSITKIGILRRLASLRMGIASIAKILAANPWTAAAAAIGIFTAAVVDAVKKVDYMGKAMKRLTKYKEEDEEVTVKETARLKQYFDWLKKTEKGTAEYNAAKAAIMKNYGGYLEKLNLEIDKLGDLEEAYKKVEEAVLASARAKVAEKAITGAEESYAASAADPYGKLREFLLGRGDRSTEEIDNIMLRIRRVIDEGKEMPAELQSIIDSFGYIMAVPGSLANLQGSNAKVNPFQENINLIRAARKAYDAELKGIEDAYGLPIGKILAGGNKEDITVPPLGGSMEDSEKLAAAKKDQQAVLAAIELFYAQQKQVINQQYLNKEISEEEHEEKMTEIEQRMLRSRIAARRALLDDPEAQKEWQEETQRMAQENIATSDENAAALAAINRKNLKTIGDDLRKYGDGEMDGIRKNMEQDRLTIQDNLIKARKEEEEEYRKEQERIRKQQEEIQRILLENDFTGKVVAHYAENWKKLGISLSQVKEDMQAFMRDMNDKIYPQLFNIDINTDEGLASFRTMFEGVEGLAFDAANAGADAMRLLYYQAIQYGDDMADATRRARKFGQRVTEEKWRQSGGMERLNNLSAEEKHIYSMNSMLSGVGLMSDEVANDAMIELYRKRVEELQKLRDLTIQNNGDIEEANKKLEEAMNNLSEAVVDKTLAMLETLKSFTDTLPEFGSALGEAFATEDATERMEALQEATKDFVQDLGEATKEMIVQWVKQKIQHALLKKSMVSTEKQTQGEITDTQQEGTEAQTAIAEVGGTLMQNIASKVKDFVVGKKKEQAAESVQTEASETSSNATMGIASGAAKTVGELGWWGIPLVAVITALLNGLLSYAMGKVGNLFSGKSAEATAAPATTPAYTGKVVSGMLTYDSGNVQSVLGSDGTTYAARVGGLGSGSGIVTAPTLTNVGGQAALVGELGPEVVIGRATTRAMMQDNPRLLHSLVQFDRLHSGRGFRTYDSGNLTDFGGVDGSDNPMAASIDRMNSAIDRLNRRLEKDIVAHIVRKEVVTEAIDGMYEEKQRGRNKNLTRLLG